MYTDLVSFKKIKLNDVNNVMAKMGKLKWSIISSKYKSKPIFRASELTFRTQRNRIAWYDRLGIE
jgi:hypothetical protein